MTIHHHPSDDSVLAYANGSLGPVFSLAVGAHVDGCGRCRETLGVAEAMGGMFLDATIPAALSEAALSHVLGRLDMPPAARQPIPRGDGLSTLPPSLRNQPIGTRRWLAPGIWTRPLLKDRADGARVYLLGAARGKALPHHGHHGIEMTQVLEGEFFDGETRYGPGDFLEADEKREHRPLVGPDADCICVIASQGVPRGLPGFLMRVLA